MPKTPNFEVVTDSITQTDIDHFLRSNAPEDVKTQVRQSPDQRTKMRFVAGYLIRSNQVSPSRLALKDGKTGSSARATVASPSKAVRRRKTTA